MKNIEALNLERKQRMEELNGLYKQLEELQEAVSFTEKQIKILDEQIKRYDEYVEARRIEKRDKAILKWLTGQEETYNDVGVYNGIISNITETCMIKGDKPHGEEDEIYDIMRAYGITTIEVITKFVPCWSWGNYKIYIKLFEINN